MKRIGILGCGGVGKAHAKALKSLGEKFHVYDKYKSNQEHMLDLINEGEKYALAHDSFDGFMDAIDAMIIALPNNLHLKYILRAIDYNKYVLCEKPLVSSAKELISIKKLFHSDSFLFDRVFIGFNYRYLEIVNEIKSLIKNGILGSIINITLSYRRDSVYRNKSISWRDADHGNSSGSLGDLGIHLIDLVSFILNDKINQNSLKVLMSTKHPYKGENKVEVDDYSKIYGKTEKETYFSIHANKCAKDRLGIFLDITGTKSSLKYHTENESCYEIKSSVNWEKKYTNRSDTISPESEIYGWQDSFIEENKDFIRKINRLPANRLANIYEGIVAQEVLSMSLG